MLAQVSIMRILHKPSPASLLVLSTVAVMAFVEGVYSVSTAEKPAVFDLLYRVAAIWSLGYWLVQDSRRTGFSWPYDLGLFLIVLGLLLVLYYPLKTRGIRALLLLGIVAVTYLTASILGMAVGALIET